MKRILITEVQPNRGAHFYILPARGAARTPAPRQLHHCRDQVSRLHHCLLDSYTFSS